MQLYSAARRAWHKAAFAAALLVAPAWAQTRMTIDQLQSFVRSSVQLKHPDKKIAEYLKSVHLANRLDVAVIEDLVRSGAGPKTYEALRELQKASAELSAPPVAPPKPAAQPLPPPPPAEQKRIIDEVREYALSYVKRLPDFICTQVTRRYIDPSGMEFWQRTDTITTRLTYFERKEDYKVLLVNNQMTEIPYDRLGGATSTGEFGTLLREIFEPETDARFQWERWATLRGAKVHVFNFRVEQPRSQWRISYQRTMEVVPGYRGLIYVDANSPAVLRIMMEAENIPQSFPIQQASTVLDYDFTEIASNTYLLPLRAVVRMREGKYLIKNEVEFRIYRKFGAETTITFDTPEPLPDDKTKEQPAKP
jgi:hypothetical protein